MGQIKNYRKVLIANLPNLNYLDDRPVFEDERRCTMAWMKGGTRAEAEERKRIREERQERHEKNLQAFKEMGNKAKERREEEEKRLLNERSTRLVEKFSHLQPDQLYYHNNNNNNDSTEDDQKPPIELSSPVKKQERMIKGREALVRWTPSVTKFWMDTTRISNGKF